MASNGDENNKSTNAEDEESTPEFDPQYDPIIFLPEVTIPTLEEDETELLNLRAKLFRYDSKETPAEWKVRGTGTVKILKHKENKSVRVVMRRDKTLKLCANHFIQPAMELKPHGSCDRAWLYSVTADYADETAKPELLAIKFSTVENAKKWKEVFENSKLTISEDDENSKVKEKVDNGEEIAKVKETEEIKEDTKLPEENTAESKEAISAKLAELALADSVVKAAS